MPTSARPCCYRRLPVARRWRSHQSVTVMPLRITKWRFPIPTGAFALHPRNSLWPYRRSCQPCGCWWYPSPVLPAWCWRGWRARYWLKRKRRKKPQQKLTQQKQKPLRKPARPPKQRMKSWRIPFTKARTSLTSPSSKRTTTSSASIKPPAKKRLVRQRQKPLTYPLIFSVPTISAGLSVRI